MHGGLLGRLVVIGFVVVILNNLPRVSVRPVLGRLAVVIVVLADDEVVGRVLDVLLVLGELKFLLVIAHIVGTVPGCTFVATQGTQPPPAPGRSCRGGATAQL